MIRFAFLLTALISASSASGAACRDDRGRFVTCPSIEPHHPNCKAGKLCGRSCIAKDKVCHKP